MFIQRFCTRRPHQLLHKINKKRIHNNYVSPPHSPSGPSQYDWFNFVTSCVNCTIICSILWGFESYKEKIKLIEDTNIKINEIAIAYTLLEKKCIIEKRITKRRF